MAKAAQKVAEGAARYVTAEAQGAELLLQNLDVWTAATRTKSTSGRGSGGKIELAGIKKLRELILELAVRGKLVPQDPNDEPASMLLEQIQEEKARLIAEGKLKKQKTLPPIDDSERPFRLPEGWAFERLGSVLVFEYGNNLPEKRRTNTGEFPVYGSNGVVGTHSKAFVCESCIVIGRKGSAGALNLCLSKGCCVTDVAYYCVPPTQLDIHFVFKQLHTVGLDKMGKGIKPGLSRNEAYNAIIGIPPINEQHRIVAKVDELMTLCDQLERQTEQQLDAHQQLVETLLGTLTQSQNADELAANWQRLAEHFDLLFSGPMGEWAVDRLKDSILQLAVMGKLVPQAPNDEPASVLLERIQQEKARLIAEGKIKKQKPLPPISEKEKPFELPSGWSYVHLSEVAVEIGTGPFGSMVHKSEYISGGTPLINPSHMIDDRIVDNAEVSVSTAKAQELSSYTLESNDMVLARRGEVGRCAIVTEREHGWLCGTGSFRLRLGKEINRLFFAIVFRVPSTRLYLAGNSVGTTMVNLNHSILNKLPVALPQLEEQRRIVDKVSALFDLCDSLKLKICAAGETECAICDTLVEKALSTKA